MRGHPTLSLGLFLHCGVENKRFEVWGKVWGKLQN